MDFQKEIEKIREMAFNNEPWHSGGRVPLRERIKWGPDQLVSNIKKVGARRDGAGMVFEDYVVYKAKQEGLVVSDELAIFISKLVKNQLDGNMERAMPSLQELARKTKILWNKCVENNVCVKGVYDR